MKAQIIFSLFVGSLISVSFAENTKLRDTFALDKVTHFVFVDEVSLNDDFRYEKRTLQGETKGKLANALVEVSGKPYIKKMDYPFIGTLAHVMLLDKDSKPLCVMEVVNWNRTVVFYGVKLENGKNMIDKRYAKINSDAIARWVYDQMKANYPDEVQKLNKIYTRMDKNLETLLFPKIKKTK